MAFKVIIEHKYEYIDICMYVCTYNISFKEMNFM